MKFGQNLPRNQVPEWARSYIDYKALKKLIKTAQTAIDEEEEPDLAGFFFTLDRQLEDVDTFYNRKYGEFARRLRLLYDRYGMISKLPDGMEQQDMEDLIGALLELRGQYRKLQWYGEVNRRGFVKITKKLNKKIPSSTAQSRYMSTKVDPKQFATNGKLTQDMRAINEWLSSLGDIHVADDADSVHSESSRSLRRIPSVARLNLSSSSVDAMEHAVKKDNLEGLETLLSLIPPNAASDAQKNLRLDLLQRAITYRSMRSIVFLLRQVSSIDQEDDMNKRNCLHRLVISIGRTRVMELSGDAEKAAGIAKSSIYINAAEAPVRAPGSFKVEERDPNADVGKDEQAEQLLIFVLEHLSDCQKPGILSKDNYGRMPLHYAAQYGLVAVSQALMKYMQDWDLFDVSDGVDSAVWQDADGYAPIHLAVVNGHYRTAKALLHLDDQHQFLDHRLTSKHVEQSGASLALAAKANYSKIVKLLVDAGVDINYQDENGETALHVAARFGHDECAATLLEGTSDQQMNVELVEKTYGWTALFIACVDGHFNIVKMLIPRSIDVTKPDQSGWTPQEHAALRGHLDIARFLAQFPRPPSVQPSPNLAPQDGPMAKAKALMDRRSNGVSKEGSTNGRLPEPVKEFGHRYLLDESMINVSLGTIDERQAKDKPPVVLDNIEISYAHATQLDTALSLMVSASGASGERTLVDLPIQENISTSPFTFKTKDPSKVKLYFDLVPTYAGDPEKPEKRIARGVALLSSIKPNIGFTKMSLQGDLSVPLMSATTLDVIGTVNFNFLIIKPFSHPNMSISEDRTYWKKSSTLVIGHRGSGKNMNTKTSLQLGENTIQSFITAANLGASYVEFDVQMTKDLVPVIYHDFLVSETGADVPVHTLTLEQFLALGDGGNPRKHHSTRTPSPSWLEPPASNGTNPAPPKSRVHRSLSVGEDVRPDTRDRMRHTRDFKAKGFKGNTRGDSIHAPFTTLEEMFTKLDPAVGFNIEVKYPMLFESEEQGMDAYAVELNSFVDTVLAKVYDHAPKGRNVLFSSFHPDICLLLSFKQPSMPVLFLTDAGTSEVGDIRASSLQEAIRFASRWNLLGIVSACEPFVLCPRLIPVVKNSNLVCFSYGALNNIAENSKLQAREGIDAVIVDSVARVRKGLTGGPEGMAAASSDPTAASVGEGVERVVVNGAARPVAVS
ncbi:Glycerophosphoryl diester phosphodiesterase family-domain-containing protein [Neohortaea acidophila]|uniref:Glycerophosphoryl diester phosphodiesterase family-domain-containing protein n=1 Tax=Neohortaea acidophila TaxID=245834 RepID=A0A6A6PSV1_9PEZI|nr:Glycerophosphoryl diester phosphodiesterase family-domain-containing protein [Neohortaea acidophila]KAF2483178.1 Glycerophosphoryl diester phosphodiesterase family-domain-containing protein [Neohortaea acidophila]